MSTSTEPGVTIVTTQINLADTSVRNLVSADLFDRLVDRLAADESLSREDALRVMEQTLMFLKMCADHPQETLAPTKAVDPGWHTFILHTEDYAEFCTRVAGRFIHHRPMAEGESGAGEALRRTVELLRTTKHRMDAGMWSVDEAKCNQCHSGCHDSPG
jgi:hypothetical protein